jgi:hypothetical protein
MNYVTAWTDALAFHRDLPFSPLHYTYVTFTSPPRLTSLHLTSLHFTSLHFFDDFHPTFTSLHLTYHSPNPLPKITWFAGESPSLALRNSARKREVTGLCVNRHPGSFVHGRGWTVGQSVSNALSTASGPSLGSPSFLFKRHLRFPCAAEHSHRCSAEVRKVWNSDFASRPLILAFNWTKHNLTFTLVSIPGIQSLSLRWISKYMCSNEF